jgi:hypothetical protein
MIPGILLTLISTDKKKFHLIIARINLIGILFGIAVFLGWWQPHLLIANPWHKFAGVSIGRDGLCDRADVYNKLCDEWESEWVNQEVFHCNIYDHLDAAIAIKSRLKTCRAKPVPDGFSGWRLQIVTTTDGVYQRKASASVFEWTAYFVYVGIGVLMAGYYWLAIGNQFRALIESLRHMLNI